MTARMKFPKAIELHQAARDPSAPAPEEFVRLSKVVATAERDKQAALLERDELIREARQIGISYVALARWTGLSTRRLHDIVEDR